MNFFQNITATDAFNNLYVAGSTINSSGNSDIILQKFNRSGNLLWQQTYNGTANLNDMAAALYIDNNNYIYLTGTVTNTALDGTDLAVLKYDSNGSLIWTHFDNGPSSSLPDDAGIAITGNNLGIVFIAGASATDTSYYDYFTLAINSTNATTIWNQRYDYANLGEIPKSIIYTSTGISGYVSVYGGSQSYSLPDTWESAVVRYAASSGNVLNVNRSVTNVISGINGVYDLTFDDSHNTYIAGTYLSAGTTGYDMAIYKLDSNLNLIWEAYFDGNGLDDRANGIRVDENGNVIVVGSVRTTSQGKNIGILKYDSNGNLLWNREYSGLADLDDSGTQLVIADSNHVYFTAEVNDNGYTDYKTFGIDGTGTLFSSATFDSEYHLKDTPDAITIDNEGNIVVTGKVQVNDTVFLNKTIKYSVFEKTFDPYYQDSIPLYNNNELIIRFNKNIIKADIIDKKNLLAGKLSDFVDSTALLVIQNKLGFKSTDLETFKIFTRMTTADSVSISRLGKTVKIEPFWATLSVMMPKGSDLDEIIDSLNTIKSYVLYTEKNRFATLSSIPNDYAINYNNQNGLVGLHLGIECVGYVTNVGMVNPGAWDIEVGKSDVKVGVYDSGINWRHEDFGGPSWNNSRVKGGWDYFNNVSPNVQTTPDSTGHGTKCAGIIGAIRNNSIGVAGVAGGDYDNNIDGVSLYSMKIIKPGSINYADITSMANAIIEGASDNPSTNYGFGLQINNHSWVMGLDSTALSDTLFITIRNAMNYAYHNASIQVAASGNVNALESPNQTFYPASFNDDWILKVGASAANGQRASFSAYGSGVDIIAPGVASLVYTLLNYDAQNGPYGPFEGTSAAAPHGSGVAALMLSQHNPMHNNLYPNNLAPEDVEYIIQKTASPKDGGVSPPLPIPNNQSGYGLLNAYRSLQKSSLPYRVRHFESTVPSDVMVLVDTNQNIGFPEGIDNLPNGATVGNSSIYKITQTFNHSLPINETFLAGWERNSSCNLFGLTNTIYNTNWSNVTLDNINDTTATLTGYIYITKITLSDNSTEYLTFPEPDSNSNYNFAYSIHTFDTNYNLGLDELSASEDILVYPNPSNSFVSFKMPPTDYNLTAFDITGKSIKIISDKALTKNEVITIDISKFEHGMYLFVFENENKKIVKRIIKN